MTLPSGYTAHTQLTQTVSDDAPEWELIENLCMHVDEVYVDADGYQVGMLINDPNNELVAAMWHSAIDDEITEDTYFSFHVVVHPEHQGKKLGSALLEAAVSLYHQYKAEHPALQADVYVVNEKVMQGLFNRGFSVSEDLRENPGDFVVAMAEAPKLADFFKLALKSDPAACSLAMDHVAAQYEVAVPEVFELCRRWCEQPDTLLSTEQQKVEQVVLRLPLSEFDQKYMWSQVQKYAEQHALFPLQELPHETPSVSSSMTMQHLHDHEIPRASMRR